MITLKFYHEKLLKIELSMWKVTDRSPEILYFHICFLIVFNTLKNTYNVIKSLKMFFFK